MTTAPAEIFKAYDVRGVYGEQIDGDVAEAVGRGFVRVLAGLASKDFTAAGMPSSSRPTGSGASVTVRRSRPILCPVLFANSS